MAQLAMLMTAVEAAEHMGPTVAAANVTDAAKVAAAPKMTASERPRLPEQSSSSPHAT